MNEKEKFNDMKAKANNGCADSQFEVACMYADGIGIEASYRKALCYLFLAAEQGHELAKNAIKTEEGRNVGGEDEAYLSKSWSFVWAEKAFKTKSYLDW
jgi:TPR repeat protein